MTQDQKIIRAKVGLLELARQLVDQVATLAQALQVARPVVGRIVIEMRRREDHARVNAAASRMRRGRSVTDGAQIT